MPPAVGSADSIVSYGRDEGSAIGGVLTAPSDVTVANDLPRGIQTSFVGVASTCGHGVTELGVVQSSGHCGSVVTIPVSCFQWTADHARNDIRR